MDETKLTAVVDALTAWVPRLLDEPDRAAAIVTACRDAARTAPDSFVEAVAHVERAAHAHSRHLLLFIEPDGGLVPDAEERGWPPPDLRDVRRRGGGVSGVTRTDDGVVTVVLDTLDALDVCEPQIDAAIALTRGATGVVLDLRRNGGGDPATVARVAGFLLGGPPQPLSQVVGRAGDVTRWSTDPPAASLTVPDGVPISVLVSSHTFSSAEALAYHLRVRRRARIFGENTPGAADHVTPFNLTEFVHAQLPVARVVDEVTNTSWERIGVRPDHPCTAGEAHDAALAWHRSPNAS